MSCDVQRHEDALLLSLLEGTLHTPSLPILTLPVASTQPPPRVYQPRSSTHSPPHHRARAPGRPNGSRGASSRSGPAPIRPRPPATLSTPTDLPPLSATASTSKSGRETRATAPRAKGGNSVLFPATLKGARAPAPLKLGPDGLPIPKRSHKRQVIDAFGNKVDAVDTKRVRHSVPVGMPRERVKERTLRVAGEEVDERLYCICRRISFGEMIACENEQCATEWVRFSLYFCEL